MLYDWLYGETLDVLENGTREAKNYLHSEASKAEEIEKTKTHGMKKDDSNFKLPLVLKTALTLQKRLVAKFMFPGYQTVVSSKGDVTQIAGWKNIEKAVTVILDYDRNFISNKGQGKYFRTLEATYLVLTSRKTEFKKSFMKNNANPVRLLYITLCFALLNMLSILTYAVNNHIKSMATKGGFSVDSYIAKKPKLKRIFDETDGVLSDRDLVKFIKVDFNSSKLIAESEQDLPMDLIGESDMVSLTTVVKFGLAAVTYKIFGLARFIIYYCFFAKFYVERVIDDARRLLTYYSTESGSQKERLQQELDTSEREYIVTATEAVVDAEKEIKDDQKANATEVNGAVDF